MARKYPEQVMRRMSPLKDREWQEPPDYSGELAQKLQSRRPQRHIGTCPPMGRRQIETRPLPPPPDPAAAAKSFHPSSSADHVPEYLSNPVHASETPVSGRDVPPHHSPEPLASPPLPGQIPPPQEGTKSKTAALQKEGAPVSRQIVQQSPARVVPRPKAEGAAPHDALQSNTISQENPELDLPSIRELEQQELQRRQEEGSDALHTLEQEARSQEIERIKHSHIEVPELNLKMREGNSYLHTAKLHKRYGRKIAVADISISLRQGEVVGLLGPNGAGKTTCFYMIAGFVHPTRGEIIFNEENISRWPMYKRARKGISYLPQESSIFRSLTVEQNLLAILEYRRDLNRKGRIEMANFLMEHLGVTRLRKQKASTLSGGERRRVEVARALTLEPQFLLLDEPFAGIDPIAVSEIKGIIRALAQSNIGILITDHNVRDTLDITDRSYIVNLGEILVSGSREELIASKAAREVYLGAEFS